MLVHLRGLRKGLHLISLIVLTQTLFLNVTSGQRVAGSDGKAKADSSGKVDSKAKSGSKAKSDVRATVLAVDPVLVTLELPENLELTIAFNPCKGEVPGNVLGVSEQSQVAERVAAFVKKLGEPDLKTRACAARQLGYIGREAKDALPYLIKLAHDEKNNDMWRHVEKALWAIGPGRPVPAFKDSKSSLAELVELSTASDVYVRLYATFTLGYYRPISDEKVIVQALISATKDQDGMVRWMALTGLGRLGPIASDAVPVLIQTLKDKEKSLRSRATIALGGIGPGAAEAVPALLDQLHHSEYSLSYDSAIALGRIGPVILPLLEPEIKTDPIRVLNILEHMGPAGAPLVIEALHSNDKKVQKKAMQIVGWLGPPAKPAVPLLAAALEDQDGDIRSAAANALGYLGPVARTAVPALIATLTNKDSWTQCTAATALGGIGPDARSAVPDLLRLMNLPIREQLDEPQRCAAEGLMKMSPETRAQVPVDMIKRVEDWHARVRSFSPLFETDETRPKPKPAPKKKPAEIY